MDTLNIIETHILTEVGAKLLLMSMKYDYSIQITEQEIHCCLDVYWILTNETKCPVTQSLHTKQMCLYVQNSDRQPDCLNESKPSVGIL